MAREVELRGYEELMEALRELPKALHKGVLRSALKKAGEPVVNLATALAPRAFGKLAGSIDLQTTLTKGQRKGRAKWPGTVEVFIGPTWPQGAHGHLLEFGTIKMGAQPFLRPAWDSLGDHTLRLFRDELADAIEKARKRFVKGGGWIG